MKQKRIQEIRNDAESALAVAAVREPPVPVEEIARKLGIAVRYQAFDGELSGMLVRSGTRWAIGVNSLDAPTRQRFTVAHEIGHWKLHGEKEKRDAYVDRSFTVRLRSPVSSAGTDDVEIEANRFAAELLMPRDMLLADLFRDGADFDGFDAEERIASLARRYEVSPQAMTIRLMSLGLGDVLGLSAE